MPNPTISLVIPAHNEEHYIGACLDYAIKNSRERFLEIIVIDNASTDKTREVAERRNGVRVVTEQKKGLSRARQRGLEEAKGDFIAYFDADTRVPSTWFHKLERALHTRPDLVCVSGPYRYYDARWITHVVLTALWWVSFPLTYRVLGYMVIGGNFVAKRSALLAMGGFDTNIDFYGEDTDVARRLSKQGKVLFSMGFFTHSSVRRFVAEGLTKTIVLYVLNFLWVIVFHRPLTRQSTDVRTP